MAALIYEPQSIKDPQNHPRRLYFSCCREDFSHFAKISADIWAIEKDCVIAHIDFSRELEVADHFPEIDDSQILVIPVTRKLLTTPNHAWAEFLHAAENKMAILPVLMDADAEALFNEKSGERQFLVPSDPDYPEKLQRFLQSVLVKDDLAKRVREAFPLKIFLSYCREDRSFVAELMRLIHAKDEYRQIAIWYDKYLSVGINFEDTIFEQIDGSEVFGITLTPNLVGRPNYVQKKEYPYARDQKKRIILFEVLSTDKESLGGFEGVERFSILAANDEKTFYQALAGELEGLVTQTRSAQPGETDYLVGMAYLNGLQVEFDRSYAAGRLERAGNQGSLPAILRLVTMYRNGIGVSRDAGKAIKWQKKATEKTGVVYRRAYEEAATLLQKKHQKLEEETVRDVLWKLVNAASDYYAAESELARLLAEECKHKESDKRYEKMRQIAQQMDKLVPELEFGQRYGITGNVEHALTRIVRGESPPSAKRDWQKAMELYKKEPDGYQTAHNAVRAGFIYGHQIANAQPNEAIRIWADGLQIVEAYLQTHPNSVPFMETRVQLCRDIGQVFLSGKLYADARVCLEQALAAAEECKSVGEENPYMGIIVAMVYRLIGISYAEEGNAPLAKEVFRLAAAELDAAEETGRTKSVPTDYMQAVHQERSALQEEMANLID